MKKLVSILLLNAFFCAGAQARTLQIIGDITNNSDSVVYTRLCASDSDETSIENCPEPMRRNLRIEPNERAEIDFIVHLGGYRLLWKVIMPREGLLVNNGKSVFKQGVASVVLIGK
jgi:hypothetical protein